MGNQTPRRSAARLTARRESAVPLKAPANCALLMGLLVAQGNSLKTIDLAFSDASGRWRNKLATMALMAGTKRPPLAQP